jgi:hypothetical protein
VKDPIEHSIGQTWKDKRNKPTSTFTVLRCYVRTYQDGNIAQRVKGVLVTGIDGRNSHLRDLDSRSAHKMFPYILFQPQQDDEHGS